MDDDGIECMFCVIWHILSLRNRSNIAYTHLLQNEMLIIVHLIVVMEEVLVLAAPLRQFKQQES